MTGTKLVKSNEPLPSGKMMLDDEGRVMGIAIEDSTPNSDGTHSVRIAIQGDYTYPGDASTISPVYMSPSQISAQAENPETFEDLLDAYARDTASGAQRAAMHERQLILAHVKRLEARQITPEMQKIYEIYLRDEERGDPELRDIRFQGAAIAFFTRFLRTVNPDWK